MYIHQSGYTWYILRYTMYIHQVYTWYIHGYTWYIIGCRVFYSTRHHGNCARGKGGTQKAQPDCRQRSPPVAGGGGYGSGGGGVAGVFPFS